MICFSVPRYPGEIRELLLKSGRTTQQSQLLLNNPHSRLTKLIERGWIIELSKADKKKILIDVNDKRAKRRRYVISTFDPIIDYFKGHIELAKNEERQLKHLLEKKTFRPIFSWEFGFRTFDSVKEFLFQLTFWTSVLDKYMEPYRIKKEKVDRIGKEKLFTYVMSQLFEKRNVIAERIAPEFKVKWTSSKKDFFYSFMNDASDKLKPPLFDKLISISNNKKMFFEMAITFLSCGEFINEFHHEQSKEQRSLKK